MLRFENGSIFIGAEKELSKGFLEINQNKIRRFLQNLGSDWIIFKEESISWESLWWNLGVPNQFRAVLGSLLKTHECSLNDKDLNTLMIEVEPVVNFIPLTTETLQMVKVELPFHLQIY